PHLVADYHRRFDNADFASRSYAQHLSQLVSQARERYGLNRRRREEHDDLGDHTESLNLELTTQVSTDPRSSVPRQRTTDARRRKPPSSTGPVTQQRRLFA